MDHPSKEIRRQAFLKLKPACIAVNQFALETSNSSGKDLTQALSNLLRVLSNLAYLDAKLSDYVFFPLSHVFREHVQVPARATELALECLLVLLKRDWARETEAQLVEQVFILLGSFVDTSSSSERRAAGTEEITENALKCLEVLFASLGAGQPGEERKLNVLGYVISGLLDHVVERRSSKIQYHAISALRTYVSSAQAKDTLRNFLPGIVSSLAKILRYEGSTRTASRVLVVGLSTLERTLRTVFGDATPSMGEDREDETTATSVASASDEWQNTNAEQVRTALAGVFKLRRLPNVAFLQELGRLCTTVCVRCKSSLHSSRALALETLTAICGHEQIRQEGNELRAIQLFLTEDETLLDLFKTLAHEWLSALPRIMLSNEGSIRAAGLGQVHIAHEILQSLGSDMAFLNRSLVTALIESTVAILNNSRPSQIREVYETSSDLSRQLMIANPRTARTFESLPSVGSDQADILAELQDMAQKVFGAKEAHELRSILCEDLPTSGHDRLAVLWLLSTSIKSAATVPEFSDLIDFPADNQSIDQQIPDSAYTDCLDILTTATPGAERDWRLEAMALQIIALRSQEDGPHFRSELVDVLYPVVERIGAESALLREYAFASLNVIASACGFENASQLIVQNADYLVNSIALKFNTFELSPQTPYVLSMMIELCGPQLVPYLDDLVQSIFSVLASFHGYPRLVEPLFMVLESIVKQSKVAQVDGSDASTETTPKRAWQPISVSEVVTLVRQRRSRQNAKLQEESSPPHAADHESDDSNDAAAAIDKPKPPSSKTDAMVLSIVSLSQHYLTSRAPKFRQRLLQLTGTGCTALRADQDQLLPLINDLWPVVVQRLHDPEFFVCIAAADAVAAIFVAAGDFMASRVADHWRPLHSLCARTRALVDADRARRTTRRATPAPTTTTTTTMTSTATTPTTHSSAQQVWEALVRMLLSLVRYVRIDAEVQDELMELLREDVASRPDVRAALEILNADVVWLEMERQRPEVERRVPRRVPSLEGYRFAAWQV